MLIVDAQTTPAPIKRTATPDARLTDLLEQINRRDAAPQATNPTPALAREGLAALTRTLCGQGPRISVVRDDALVDAANEAAIPIRLYDPAPTRELPVCLYLHGGGHMAGSIAVYDPICRRLAATADCRVVAVEYRLAPEHPYPRGLEDCAKALALLPAWLAAQGMGLPGGLTVAGDSGGGALTASLAALTAERDDLRIARQVLIYPSLDYTMGSSEPVEPQAGAGFDSALLATRPSIRENASGYLLDGRRMQWYFDQYFQQGEDRAAASPLYMPAVKLPPTLMITAGFCPLRDEGYAYADRLRRMDVSCAHLIHAFLNLHALVSDACDAVYQTIARFIRGEHASCCIMR